MSGTGWAGSQLALNFQRNLGATFATYFGAANAEAVATLQSLVSAENTQYVYLWGQPGTGKTHLLQAVCDQATSAGRAPAFVPLKNAEGFNPEICEGLENLDLVCIDDLDAVAGQEGWERALFALYNALRDRRRVLVMSSQVSPRDSAVQLADFRSRLSWGLVYQLKPLSDEDRRLLVKQRAQQRGLELPEDVLGFMLNHCPRDPGSLSALVDRLDAASLSAQRRVTIPFVKRLLES